MAASDATTELSRQLEVVRVDQINTNNDLLQVDTKAEGCSEMITMLTAAIEDQDKLLVTQQKINRDNEKNFDGIFKFMAEMKVALSKLQHSAGAIR